MNFLREGKKIVAVARNFVKHAQELNNPVPSSPVIFLKPTTSYITEGKSIIIPTECTELHHEVELGVVIGKTTKDIKENDALSVVSGYCLALDMTARELQSKAKAAGLPWTVSKGYNTFCPVSNYVHKSDISDPQDIELWLKVDGVEKQRGKTNLMIFPIAKLISHISHIMTLEEGDVILTGTPEGVGPVKPGQTITAGITGILEMKFPVIAHSKL